MTMRTLKVECAQVRQVTLVTEPASREDNIDVWADLIDGRRFGFTIFTLGDLRRRLAGRRAFVSPGMLVVAELSDDAIIEAICDAASQGIEHFGVLQEPTTEK
jgi:hypothetical protein